MEELERRITYQPKEGDATTPNGKRLSIRQSNIELLRIICMIFIIAHHFCVHIGMAFDPNVISINRIWYDFLYTGGKIGDKVENCIKKGWRS